MSPMLTESALTELLRNCYDPEIPLNLIDLGVVKRVTILPADDAPGAGIAGVPLRQRVEVYLLRSSGNADAEAQLRAQVANLLAGSPEVWQSSVQFIDEPAWSPGRISPEGRRQLRLDRPGQSNLLPILNNRVS